MLHGETETGDSHGKEDRKQNARWAHFGVPDHFLGADGCMAKLCRGV